MVGSTSDASVPVANIKVMSPSPQLTTSLKFALPLDSTIRQLKDRITTSLDSRPDHTQQRLIYRGRILDDNHSIGSILGASANGENVGANSSLTLIHFLGKANIAHMQHEASDSYTFHLALRPSGATPVGTPSARSSFFPERPSTTSPTAVPTHTEESRAAVLQRQRESIQETIGNVRQHLDRISDLTNLGSSRASSAPAVVTRVETRISYGPREISTVSTASNPRITRTTTTRTTTATLRMTSRGPPGVLARQLSIPVTPITISPRSDVSILNATGGDMSAILRSLQAAPSSQPLYLLQGPEGQYALLACPNTSTTSPQNTQIIGSGVEDYLPGESPNSPILPNIPSLEGISPQTISQILSTADSRLPAHQNQRNRPQNEVEGQDLLVRELNRLAQARQQQQHQRQQPQLRVRQINIGDVYRRIQDGGVHIWLAIRLIIFVVLFSGGGGWRRRATLGTLALVIFIWQTGILNNQFRNARALYRELFPPQELHVLQQPNHTMPVQAATNGEPISPAATAQLLVQRDGERRQTRVREVYESVERGLTLFIASLVPGMHERHVRAHEERERQRLAVHDAGAGAGVAGAPGGQANAVAGEAAGAGGQAQEEQRPVEDAMGGMLLAGL
ncbi:hypothetical protein BDZ91DRAFT_790187 [Kalaharituber pfeilii]|nr:hypothetical protein BDZ91DRAFT_790187 [Kalaharituber pfeilii]